MPRISFARQNRAAFDVEKGANLMQALLAAGIPVASSCHGDGVCAKCRLQVQGAPGALSQPNETEKFLAERFQLQPGTRISCQTQVWDDITLDSTYW